MRDEQFSKLNRPKYNLLAKGLTFTFHCIPTVLCMYRVSFMHIHIVTVSVYAVQYIIIIMNKIYRIFCSLFWILVWYEYICKQTYIVFYVHSNEKAKRFRNKSKINKVMLQYISLGIHNFVNKNNKHREIWHIEAVVEFEAFYQMFYQIGIVNGYSLSFLYYSLLDQNRTMKICSECFVLILTQKKVQLLFLSI